MFETLDKNLDAYIQELTECLDFVSASSQLRPRLREYVDWTAAKRGATQLITRFLGSKNVREQVIYRALYVSGHAAFEQFARDVVAQAADYISTATGPYDSLWKEMKMEHVYRTGQAMATIYQPLEHYTFDYDQLSKNIGGCIPGEARFKLNSDALAFIRGTLTPENLEKVIRRISIPFNWDVIASHPPLKACFLVSGTRDSAKEVKTFLEGMVKNRNRIAHSTGTAAEIGEPEVREQIRFVAAFCHALSAFVRAELSKKLKRSAKGQ
jgi:hypothetical protein